VIQLQPKSLIYGNGIKNGWRPTDHVFVSIPSLGREHVLQAHPFTIMSPAPISCNGEATLHLLIRAQSGFSRDLLKEALRRRSFTVRIDGPYGSTHARHLLHGSDVAVLVAGGSGIAVAWPLVHYLLEKRRRPTDAEMVLADEPKRQKIILMWIVHKTSHMSWVAPSALQELMDCGVELVVPRATEEIGRPDIKSFLDDVVLKVEGGERIAVVGSGPDSMGRAVRNACSSLVKEGRNVAVAIEKFGW